MTTSTMKQASDESTPDDSTTQSDTTPTTTMTVISKTDSEEDAWSSAGYNYINPFVHRIDIDNNYDLAKIYILTVVLVPIRVLGCILSLLLAWIFACIGLYGIKLEAMREKPLIGWRKIIQRLVATAMRAVYASGSFHHVSFKGQPASSKEAPILVVAPHSSYVDSIIVVATGPPSIVAKQETSEIPLLGKIINFAQPIYVQREDPNSRQNTIKEIVARARSEEDWPHVVIFAEGTCTNRSALIKFKPGAFYPGVPVQPVLLKYPNKHDTFTWTWDGPGVLRLLWLTMTQFYSRCEIEFLPVYVPNEEEQKDANLYAKNVRAVMAKALGVPTSEYSFEDVIMMSRAKDMKIPFPGDIIEIERIVYSLDLLETNRDFDLVADFTSVTNSDKIDFITFSEILQIELKHPLLHQLFLLLDHQSVGHVSLKTFLLCSLFCKLKNEQIMNFLRAIVPIYCDSRRCISRPSFLKIVKHSGKLTQEKWEALYYKIDHQNKGFISFDEFEEHTRDVAKYKFLYKKQEQIRRNYKLKLNK